MLLTARGRASAKVAKKGFDFVVGDGAPRPGRGDDNICGWKLIIKLPKSCPGPAFEGVALDVVAVTPAHSATQPWEGRRINPGGEARTGDARSTGEDLLEIRLAGESPGAGKGVVQAGSSGEDFAPLAAAPCQEGPASLGAEARTEPVLVLAFAVTEANFDFHGRGCFRLAAQFSP